MFLSFTVQDIPLTNMLAPGAFLVRRRDQSERSPKSKNETNELAHRGHSRGSHLQTSIAEDQLQQRRVHQLRRKLSEHFSGLAVVNTENSVRSENTGVPTIREIIPILVWLAAMSRDGSARHGHPLAPQSFRLALDQKIAPPSRKARSCGQHS
jgi:hypothetical protein